MLPDYAITMEQASPAKGNPRACGVFRFWKDINQFKTNSVATAGTKRSLLRSFIYSLADIFKHSDFIKCEANKLNYYAHLGIFYGFILLLLSTFLAAVYHFSGIHSPHPLNSPIKIFGNIGTVLLFIGCILAMYRRLAKKEEVGKSTYLDWFLTVMLFLVTVSGIATEVIRLAELATASCWVYLVHLWLIINRSAPVCLHVMLTMF